MIPWKTLLSKRRKQRTQNPILRKTQKLCVNEVHLLKSHFKLRNCAAIVCQSYPFRFVFRITHINCILILTPLAALSGPLYQFIMGFWRQVSEGILFLLRALELLLGIGGTSIRSAHWTLMQVLGLGAYMQSIGEDFDYYENKFFEYNSGVVGLFISTVLNIFDE